MAKISSFVQKIFGKDASNIGQIGSAAAGTKVLTTNPTTIQALTAFTNGISDVTLSSKRIIPQEELMALHYLHSMQNAYQQQEGIQEYNSGVTYFQNSIVKKAGTYEIYGSLVNDNIGNALTDVTKWVKLQDLSTNGIIFGTNSIKFSNGTLIMWGGSTNTGSSTTVTLPTSYANTSYRIILTCAQSTDGTAGPLAHYYQTLSTGSFHWTSETVSGGVSSTPSSVTISWITVGDA